MRRAYNIIITFLLVFSSPFYLFRMWYGGGGRHGFRQRFGRYDAKLKQALTNRHVVWVHLAGAEEVNLCTQLIRSLEQRLPNAKIVVSTVRTKAMRELQRRLPSHIGRIYSPLDRRTWVVRALATINPEAIVLVEAEIWPNFLWRARQRGTPVFLVNSRPSPRSLRRCQFLPFLYRRFLANLAGASVPTEREKAKLVAMGCRPELVRVVGSLRVDAAELSERRRLDVQAMLKQLGVSPEACLLVCGNTQSADEELLARTFPELKKSFPDLFLILAPERIERSREVGRMLSSRGLRCVYRNEVVNHTQHPPGEVDCLLLNTPGELGHFHDLGTVAFVGHGRVASADQNAIDTAALGKPIVLGPNPRSARELAQALLQAGGAIQARDEAELRKALTELLNSPEQRASVGEKARQFAQERLGAIERTTDLIVEKLDAELYVAPRHL